MILPASYANGFAPRDGEPLYPELWRGCVGAWNPGLGPSGLTLRDWSGFGRHGTLETAAMWGVDQRSALTPTATTQFSTLPLVALPSGANSRSVSMWIKPTTIVRRGFIGNRPVLATNGWFFGQLNGTTLWVVILGGVNVSVTVPSMLNRLMHVGMSHDASTSTLVIYENGKAVSTTTTSPGVQSTAAAAYLGREQEGEAPETFLGSILECQTWARPIAPSEMRLLATRPGIAYELAPRRRSSAAVQFNRRRRLLVGAGS